MIIDSTYLVENTESHEEDKRLMSGSNAVLSILSRTFFLFLRSLLFLLILS